VWGFAARENVPREAEGVQLGKRMEPAEVQEVKEIEEVRLEKTAT
jgi:hypothetical protein